MTIGEVWVEGPSPTPRADPITFQEIFRLVQVQKFEDIVTCMNTYHFGRESTGGSSNSLVTDWATNIVPTWKANVGAAMRFKEVYAQKILPGQDAVAAVQLTGQGASSNTPAPCPTAGVITWRTQLIGRNRRGRSYIPGLVYNSATFVGNGITWGSANLTCMTNIAQAILTRYTLGGNPYGFQLCVVSRKLWSTLPEDQWRQAASMVTRFTVQSYIATMGSRRGSRGI